MSQKKNNASQSNAPEKITVGLDIGTTKIVAIVGRKNEHGKIEILGFGKADSIGVQRGMVANIDRTIESIKRAVEEAQTNANVDIRSVYVGIAGQHIRSTQLRGTHIRENPEKTISCDEIDEFVAKMERINTEPNEKIISVIPQEFIVDQVNYTKDPIGWPGSNLEANFHVITGQVTAAKNIARCVHDAGLHMEEMILEPIASSAAVLSEEEKEAGVVLVDIGGGTTDIAIFQDNIIRHTAVIPFGGNIITQDVMRGCSIIRNYAEMLKIKFGSALPTPAMMNKIIAVPGLQGRPQREISMYNLACIIQARMEEILDAVIMEIQNSGYEKNLAAGIVITGGGANLQHVRQLTEYKTGMDTRIGIPTNHISGDMASKIASPIFSTSVGLMMLGINNDSRKMEPQQPLEMETDKNKPRFRFKGLNIEKLIDKFLDNDAEEDLE